MNTIQIKDKTFAVSIPEAQIQQEVKRVADELNRDMKGKHPLFLSVLNGSFMFAADLLRYIDFPCEVSFVKLSSYEGESSSGKMREIVGLSEELKGRTVVVVEDIIDTGFTMQYLLQSMARLQPAEVRVAVLLVKPGKLKVKLPIDYVAMRIPDDFIVGYGLDYDGYGRNYRDVYTVVEQVPDKKDLY